MSGIFSSLSASVGTLRVRPLKHWIFWMVAIGLMFLGSEGIVKNTTRFKIFGGWVGLFSGMLALGMAERSKVDLHQAAKNLSDHLDYCQECNEPSVFCNEGLRLKNTVVEILRGKPQSANAGKLIPPSDH